MKYYLITYSEPGGTGFKTLAVNKSPEDWLAEHAGCVIAQSTEISEAIYNQYKALE